MRTYGIRLSYDTSLLRCRSVDKLGYFKGYSTFYFRQIDSLRGSAGADESILGPGFTHAEGALFALRMTALREGVASVDFVTAQFFDSSLASVANVALMGTEVSIDVKTHVELPLPAGTVTLELWPLPWNARTSPLTICMRIPKPGNAMLRIVDINGRELRSLYRGILSPGDQYIAWDGREESGRRLPSGMYFAVLSGEFGRNISRIVMVD